MRKAGLCQETSFHPRSSASIKIMFGGFEMTTGNKTLIPLINKFHRIRLRPQVYEEECLPTSDANCQYPAEENGCHTRTDEHAGLLCSSLSPHARRDLAETYTVLYSPQLQSLSRLDCIKEIMTKIPVHKHIYWL